MYVNNLKKNFKVFYARNRQSCQCSLLHYSMLICLELNNVYRSCYIYLRELPITAMHKSLLLKTEVF